MKTLVIVTSLFLGGCMNAYITCESGGNCNLSQSKNVPIVVGKDIQDTGKTLAVPSKDYEGKPIHLHVNMP